MGEYLPTVVISKIMVVGTFPIFWISLFNFFVFSIKFSFVID